MIIKSSSRRWSRRLKEGGKKRNRIWTEEGELTKSPSDDVVVS